MTRLILRSQVFEDLKLSWINKGQQSLMTFENLRYKQFRLYNFNETI